MTTETRTAYRITACRPIGNGQFEDLREPATLGRALGATYVTRAEAESVAADLRSTVDSVGLDPATRYEVEELETTEPLRSVMAQRFVRATMAERAAWRAWMTASSEHEAGLRYETWRAAQDAAVASWRSVPAGERLSLLDVGEEK